jgi:hypothetical protein
MSLLLIDDQGKLWNGSSRELRLAFDSPYSGGEFSHYAILNLGFVAINGYVNSFQIRLRPAVVSDRTVATLRQWLGTCDAARGVVSSFGVEWSSELIMGATAALARIEHLVAEGRRAKPQDYIARPVAPEVLTEMPAVARIVNDWDRLSQPSGQHVLMDLLKQAFGDRYIVVKKEPHQGSLVFAELGDGLFTKYETWRTCAVGAPVEEQPDRDYGRWVAGTYNEVIRSGKPSIEDIDAIVRWPHAGRTRLRYRRVLIPLRRENSEMLLSASLMDNRIDLRIAKAS